MLTLAQSSRTTVLESVQSSMSRRPVGDKISQYVFINISSTSVHGFRSLGTPQSDMERRPIVPRPLYAKVVHVLRGK